MLRRVYPWLDSTVEKLAMYSEVNISTVEKIEFIKNLDLLKKACNKIKIHLEYLNQNTTTPKIAKA